MCIFLNFHLHQTYLCWWWCMLLFVWTATKGNKDDPRLTSDQTTTRPKTLGKKEPACTHTGSCRRPGSRGRRKGRALGGQGVFFLFEDSCWFLLLLHVKCCFCRKTSKGKTNKFLLKDQSPRLQNYKSCPQRACSNFLQFALCEALKQKIKIKANHSYSPKTMNLLWPARSLSELSGLSPTIEKPIRQMT